MNKSDLKNGLIAELRDGTLCLVAEENSFSRVGMKLIAIGKQQGLGVEECYNDDLTEKAGRKQSDVIALYKAKTSINDILMNWKSSNHLTKSMLHPYLPKKEVRVYLAHPISNTYEIEASIKLADELRNMGFTVYAAAENKSINDKTASEAPTPEKIYMADTAEIICCDIFIVNLTGGMQDGTLMEVGYVAGLNDSATERARMKKIYAYSSNKRALSPQHFQGIASSSINHLVLGAVEKHGQFYSDIQKLKADLIADYVGNGS